VGIELLIDGWKVNGIISEKQHSTLIALVRRERMSVFVELNALLYLGVLSTVGGLAWTFRDYVENLGDVAILSILAMLATVSFAYCFTKARPYARDEVASPTFAFDYILYFGCLMFSASLGFVETRFRVFGGWDTHLLIAALVFGGLAYRFDNRFVLSLALSTFAACLGLKLSAFDDVASDRLRSLMMTYGASVLAAGWLLHRQGIKRHFVEVYLHLGAHAVLLPAMVGSLDGSLRDVYLFLVVAASATAIYLGVRQQSFSFVAYGILYGYVALSARVLALIPNEYFGFSYLVFTGILVVIALVAIARRFGRHE